MSFYFELDILNAIQSLRSPGLDSLMKGITRLGNNGMVWVILAFVLLIFPRTRPLGIAVSISLCLNTLFCNIILKPAVARVRPFDVNSAIELIVHPPGDFSFPSGHTSAGFSVVGVFLFEKNKKLLIPSLILASLIAFSRLYLYVHYPTDILGGITVGLLAGRLACVFKKNIANSHHL